MVRLGFRVDISQVLKSLGESLLLVDKKGEEECGWSRYSRKTKLAKRVPVQVNSAWVVSHEVAKVKDSLLESWIGPIWIGKSVPLRGILR